MHARFHTVVEQFDLRRPPALLLAGINLVRALGLGGIPVIVASTRPDEDALASRYCAARLALPAEREAALQVLLEAGRTLAAVLGAPVPLFWECIEGEVFWRGMFELVKLPLSWPVYVSQAEAVAFAEWRGAHRVLYGADARWG